MRLNRHPSEKLWPFEFLESFRCSISSVSIYYWPELDIRVKSYGRLNLPCATMFNFERLYTSCPWIGHTSEKLWPSDFLVNFHCSISSVSAYYWPESDNRVKSYCHLNLTCAATFNFERLHTLCAWIGHPSQKLWPSKSDIRVKSYGRLNFPCALMFNFDRLHILCAWIGFPSEKLWPYEFVESFHCSISSVSIYYFPGLDLRVKSCGCLYFPCASMFN